MSAPAEVFSLGSYLAEEMIARGWDTADVIRKSGSANPIHDILVLELVLCAPVEIEFRIDDDTIDLWSHAFGVSSSMLKNLHQIWRDNPKSRQPFSCPEDLLAGVRFVTFK